MPRTMQGALPPLPSQVLGLVAHAGGAQANAVLLSGGYNEIATVATIADSVQLPLALYGTQVFVKNAGANAAQVFANSAGTDTINGTAGATGVSQAAGLGAIYECHKDTVWTRFLQG